MKHILYDLDKIASVCLQIKTESLEKMDLIDYYS